MVTIQGGKLIPMRLDEMLDPQTGRVRVRFVNTRSEMYQTLAAYMVRLKPEDFAEPAQVRALAAAARLDEAAFVDRFAGVVQPPP
jgi:6-phosphofructokinase 1